MTEPRYPEIKVKLVGTDGNAFALLGKVRGAMRKAGIEDTEIELFLEEAMSGDYNNLLRTCCEWVNVK